MNFGAAELQVDLRFGLRQIRKNPSLAILCILVLAIGIGATTAVFAVLYDVLLKPLPYREANRIVFVHNDFASLLGHTGDSAPDYVTLTAHRELFSETAAYFFNDFTMSSTSGSGYAQHVDAVNASATLFSMFGIRPQLGRAILPEDDRFGAGKVVVLSDSFWRSQFGTDPGVIGKSISLDGAPHQIVGVMPPDFNFPYPATQMWVPLALNPAAFAPDERGNKWLRMLARITPGVSFQQANAMLASVSHQAAAQDPDSYPEKTGWHFSFEPMLEEQTSGVRQWLMLSFGAVICVLLIAAINASGLLLVRATTRNREWAVRAALGASAPRLVRQILAETALLSAIGCAAGIAASYGLLRLINMYGPIHRTQIEPWALGFAIALCVISTLLAGALPALFSSRVSIEQALRSGSGRTATGHPNWRGALVAGQIGIAIVLLFMATALGRSFGKLLDVSPGFSAARVWTAAAGLPEKQYASGTARAEFFRTLVERIRALPGVESASAGMSLPFSSGGYMADIFLPGRPESPIRPAAQVDVVLPDYFKTLKIPLREGRTFTERDDAGAPSVVVIDEEFERQYFQDEDPIGKLVANNCCHDRPATIIGVMGNVATRELGAPARPHIYWPELQLPNSAMFLVARVTAETNITASVREILHQEDAAVALFDVETMPQRISDSVKLRRFVAWLLHSFAFAGMALAALGLYGMLAYLVQLRRREIAIRMALGATPADIAQIFLRYGLSLALAGLIPGLLLLAAAARSIRSFLFGMGVLDAWTIASTAAGFFAIGLIATWPPVAQAVRVQALDTLREE